MTIVWVLLALTLVRVALITAGAAMLIRPVRACPACRGETVPIRRRWLDRLAGRYEWRWCPHCRWEGIARRRRFALAGPAAGARWRWLASRPM